MELTINELRSILFNIDNQDISIRDLRKKLFDLDKYDNLVFKKSSDFDKIFKENNI